MPSIHRLFDLDLRTFHGNVNDDSINRGRGISVHLRCLFLVRIGLVFGFAWLDFVLFVSFSRLVARFGVVWSGLCLFPCSGFVWARFGFGWLGFGFG